MAKTPCVDNLISSFIDIIRLGDPEVVGSLTTNLGQILPVFYAHITAASQEGDLDTNGNIVHVSQPSFVILHR